MQVWCLYARFRLLRVPAWASVCFSLTVCPTDVRGRPCVCLFLFSAACVLFPRVSSHDGSPDFCVHVRFSSLSSAKWPFFYSYNNMNLETKVNAIILILSNFAEATFLLSIVSFYFPYVFSVIFSYFGVFVDPQ